MHFFEDSFLIHLHIKYISFLYVLYQRTVSRKSKNWARTLSSKDHELVFTLIWSYIKILNNFNFPPLQENLFIDFSVCYFGFYSLRLFTMYISIYRCVGMPKCSSFLCDTVPLILNQYHTVLYKFIFSQIVDTLIIFPQFIFYMLIYHFLAYLSAQFFLPPNPSPQDPCIYIGWLRELQRVDKLNAKSPLSPFPPIFSPPPHLPFPLSPSCPHSLAKEYGGRVNELGMLRGGRGMK